MNLELIFYKNHSENNNFIENSYIIGRENELGFPPAPITIFESVPRNRNIIYRIFSTDFSLSPTGNFGYETLSETDALRRAPSRIYEDRISGSCYFRYLSGENQHTVWLEDFRHSAAKLFRLKNLGFGRIYIEENKHSAPTVSKLFAAYGNRI